MKDKIIQYWTSSTKKIISYYKGEDIDRSLVNFVFIDVYLFINNFETNQTELRTSFDVRYL